MYNATSNRDYRALMSSEVDVCTGRTDLLEVCQCQCKAAFTPERKVTHGVVRCKRVQQNGSQSRIYIQHVYDSIAAGAQTVSFAMNASDRRMLTAKIAYIQTSYH